ncbi:hypothetical protein A167_00647 [Alcanivorax sp. S71-1-4]|jgi:Skp family chaperone for outer membrane proteins|uniref:DUF4398 domain-containing protein n=1 Tax=Isoalcanivorax pacificus W11-5 TaxID=391936 RepID=A0A0B4XM11_9GAMM|nr:MULTISPECIES: DUF4398 domain-containing protein [Alcanivoracaceae]AJD48176.1 hypothetical protein S7S_08810 [Isoalcanivorax pacificus W11-5]KAF0810367.1 hypothetical protein A167_00647 [Alcanivorax sp. S71-1-4]
MRNVRCARFATVSAAALLLAACASAPAPTEQVQAAELAISRAQSTDIPLQGQVDLTRAREKLAAAQKAMQDNDNERAARLAAESRADAELAIAKAETGKAKQAAEEMQKSIQTLQDEIRHGAGGR